MTSVPVFVDEGRGMVPNKLKLVKLHENAHLTEQCMALLNDEWPRDQSNRLKTLNKSCDNFPMCLALINDCDFVLGFVKLTSELPFNKSVFIESLVVRKAGRGKGLGRFIVNEIEKLVKLHGIDRITLTTIDKEGFYLKTGFVKTFFSNNIKKTEKETSSIANQTANNYRVPPPPNPNLFNSPNKNCLSDKILMYKDI